MNHKSLRDRIHSLADNGDLVTITEPVSTKHEIAALLKRLEPQPVLFENVTESRYRVVGNLLCSKTQFADYFGIGVADIIPTLSHAIEHPSSPSDLEPAERDKSITPSCQEVVHFEPNLDELPIPIHFQGDGGPYITAGVVIAAHPVHGQNLDFHRCMQFSPREMAVRVVKGRHFDAFLTELGQVDVAICVGNTPNILAAGATSVALGMDELRIAHALQPFTTIKAKTVDLMIPDSAEFVLEGTVYQDRRHAEGPFVDLTGTLDVVRMEPVFSLKAITHRRNAIWQALLPGSLEHKLLMGMPREPTIFREVNQVVKCLDVHVNPGGCSWLHAIVQIDARNPDDGQKAIRAAFKGHRSCKHVFIVDKDINIYDPLEVEWAMATRFQADRDMLILPLEPGSSLDPSAEPGTKLTTKVGFDLTVPIGTSTSDPKEASKEEFRVHFEKVPYPEIDYKKYISS